MTNEISKELIQQAKGTIFTPPNNEDLLVEAYQTNKGLLIAEDHSYLEGLQYQLDILQKLNITPGTTDLFIEGTTMSVKTQNGTEQMGQYEYLTTLRDLGQNDQLEKEYGNFHNAIASRYTKINSYSKEQANELATAQVNILRYALENGASLKTLDTNVYPTTPEWETKYNELRLQSGTNTEAEKAFNDFIEPYHEATNKAWSKQIDASQAKGKNVIIKAGANHQSIAEGEMPILETTRTTTTTTTTTDFPISNSNVVINGDNNFKFYEHYIPEKSIKRDNLTPPLTIPAEQIKNGNQR